MTEKDYIRIASHLNKGFPYKNAPEYLKSQLGGFSLAVDCIMDAFAEDNPRFNRDRFLDAIWEKLDSTESMEPIAYLEKDNSIVCSQCAKDKKCAVLEVNVAPFSQNCHVCRRMIFKGSVSTILFERKDHE